MKVNVNLSQSNKSTENAVNRIQKSLNKLQSAISNNKSMGNRNNTNNTNIRKKILDSKNDEIKGKDKLLTDINMHDQIPIGYSMFNDRSAIRTDKRNIKLNQNQSGLINNTTDNIPKSIQGRNTNFKKGNYIINNNNYKSVIKWKCINCGNINLLYNKICINCGKPKKYQIKKQSDNTNYPRSDKNNIINYIDTSYEKVDNDNIGVNSHNNSNNESSNEKESKQYNTDNKYIHNQKKNAISKPKSTYIIPNIMGEFNPITKSETNIIYNNPNNMNNLNLTEMSNDNTNSQNNYKKLNDLYFYGDYLESELKESNDVNIKLLEKYKNIKSEVHNLNEKNKKIKQKIEELQKKDNELKKLNTQLKNGFSLVQNKVNINFNNYEKDNTENMNKLKELELTKKQNAEKQKKYDEEIENIKQKILLLTNEEEDKNNDEENNINELIKNIEKEKKEMEENNNKYIVLLKDNELLNQDIEKLQKQIELNKSSHNSIKDIEDPIRKIKMLKENIQMFDKEINENKKITNNLINEYKNLTEIYGIDTINDDNGHDNDNNIEDDKKEYLLIKEKNNKLSVELLKLKDITQNLSESKDKIINIYEDEIVKLNNFFIKAKEKTKINKEEEIDLSESEAQKLIQMHEENEKIKKENYELIKDLDQLAQLQIVYQGLIEENQKLKTNLFGNEIIEEKQTLLKDIISDENVIEEENNDENN